LVWGRASELRPARLHLGRRAGRSASQLSRSATWPGASRPCSHTPTRPGAFTTRSPRRSQN
jgi:hypothetical protein